MKAFILIAAGSVGLLCAFASQSQATQLVFAGVVDRIDAAKNPTHIAVGDIFSGTIFFTPRGEQQPIYRFFVKIGDLEVTGTTGVSGPGFLFLELDPSIGSVTYQLGCDNFEASPGPYELVGLAFTLQAINLHGEIPPLDQFHLNELSFRLNEEETGVNNDDFDGHFTSLPTFRNLVPDTATSLTLLAFALSGLVVFGSVQRVSA